MDRVRLNERLRSLADPYIYVLCRPDLRPFYVGKGVKRRALDHEAEARTTRRLSHKLNVIRAIQRHGGSIRYVVEDGFSDEAAAHARERELISLIGRYDLQRGPLTNQTDGGEGISNPSEESRQRRRESLWGSDGDDDQKNIANAWFQRIASVRSVPVKVVGKCRIEGLWRNRDAFPMSQRQAAALAASAIANRLMIAPGARMPRRMSVDGHELVIENGVGRDILSSGMAVLADQTEGQEVFALTEQGSTYVTGAIDRNILISAGVVEPET